ncbi:9149_t:CDS:2 [Paraglomus occultum]|uniref:9149_t:CDS:1 n=1 Tax=Paraglomus occultum TaxID=144539 RepID=A0A9N9FI13_9GLOM|nr:9149_t:CDS:2 [Paraglomus occultum]
MSMFTFDHPTSSSVSTMTHNTSSTTNPLPYHPLLDLQLPEGHYYYFPPILAFTPSPIPGASLSDEITHGMQNGMQSSALSNGIASQIANSIASSIPNSIANSIPPLTPIETPVESPREVDSPESCPEIEIIDGFTNTGSEYAQGLDVKMELGVDMDEDVVDVPLGQYVQYSSQATTPLTSPLHTCFPTSPLHTDTNPTFMSLLTSPPLPHDKDEATAVYSLNSKPVFPRDLVRGFEGLHEMDRRKSFDEAFLRKLDLKRERQRWEEESEEAMEKRRKSLPTEFGSMFSINSICSISGHQSHATQQSLPPTQRIRKPSKPVAPFACPHENCPKTFTRQYNLKSHLRTHTDERPFVCNYSGCPRAFARQHDLKRHQKLHLGLKPHVCRNCGRAFARLDALNRHLRSDNAAQCAQNVSGIGRFRPESAGWYPYVASKLRSAIHRETRELLFPGGVVLRQFPDFYVGRENIWLPFLEKTLNAGAEHVLIGHSTGAVAALRYLESHRVLGVALASAYHTHLDDPNERESGYFSRPWDWSKISQNANWIIQFSSSDDYAVPIAEQRFVHNQIKSHYREFTDRGHFTGSREFPELVDTVLEFMNGVLPEEE